MVGVAHAPYQIGEGLALEGGRIGKGGDVLAGLLWVVIVFLELNPFGFLGQSTKFVYQAEQIIDGALHAHG